MLSFSYGLLITFGRLLCYHLRVLSGIFLGEFFRIKLGFLLLHALVDFITDVLVPTSTLEESFVELGHN